MSAPAPASFASLISIGTTRGDAPRAKPIGTTKKTARSQRSGRCFSSLLRCTEQSVWIQSATWCHGTRRNFLLAIDLVVEVRKISQAGTATAHHFSSSHLRSCLSLVSLTRQSFCSFSFSLFGTPARDSLECRPRKNLARSMADDLKSALVELVRFARTLRGDEKSEAQSFRDHFFRALGMEESLELARPSNSALPRSQAHRSWSSL